MIVCDRDHLGLADYVCRRNAFGRQLQSFEEDLRDRGARRGASPRGLHPGALGRGARPGRRGAGRGPRPSGRGAGRATSSPSPSTPSSPTTAGCTPPSWRCALRARSDESRSSLGFQSMRDPRVTALAQILVRHSTRVKEGDVCTIEGESAAEPLLQAVYEEVLRAGGNPIVNMALEGQSASYFEHASDAQLRVDLAGRGVGGRERRRPDRGDGEPEHPRALPGAARAPGEAPGRDPAADEAGDGAERRGHLPLGAHPVPDPRLRVRGGDGPGRLRGLLLRRLPGDRRRPRRRLGAASPRRPSGSPTGSRAAPRCT